MASMHRFVGDDRPDVNGTAVNEQKRMKQVELENFNAMKNGKSMG